MRGDARRRLAVDLDAAVERLQRLEIEAREHGLQVAGDLGMRVQHCFADDRRRRVDGLDVPVVVEHREAAGGDAAVGAVDHRRVHAVRLVRRGLDGGGGVAAGQHDELRGFQFESVRLLERRQRRRAVDEFGGRRELDVAAAGDPLAEIGERLQVPGLRERRAHRDAPRVVRRRRRQPDDAVGRVVELARGVVALRGVLPYRIVGLVEEERRVAGVFRVDVDFAAGERAAHDRRRAERDLFGDGNAVRLQHLRDDVAEQVAFGVDLRRHHDGIGGMRAGRRDGDGNGERDARQPGGQGELHRDNLLRSAGNRGRTSRLRETYLTGRALANCVPIGGIGITLDRSRALLHWGGCAPDPERTLSPEEHQCRHISPKSNGRLSRQTVSPTTATAASTRGASMAA
ncbi:protein of unknown function [Burkholderia multivorans]